MQKIMIQKWMLARGLFALAVAVACAAAPVPARAVEYGGVGGRPANPRPDNPRTESIFVYTLSPSEELSDGVRVINNTAETKTLQVYAVDSVVSTGGTFACAQRAEAKKGVGSWVTLEKTEITLESLQTEVVPFTVRAPRTAGVGEHNGCIVIQEKKERPSAQDQTGIALSFRTGIRMAVLVPGNIVRKLELTGFTVSRKDNGGVNLQARIKNLGNVSVDADVKVVTKYFFGLTLQENGGQYPVLRGETSELNFELKKPFWGGWYQAVPTVEYDPNPEAGVGTKSGKALETIAGSPVWFFSAPQPTALVVEALVFLFVLFLLFLAYIHRKRKRWIAQHWVAYGVRSGDDVKSLADRYHISWKLLASANRLEPPYALKPGDRLKVPPTS